MDDDAIAPFRDLKSDRSIQTGRVMTLQSHPQPANRNTDNRVNRGIKIASLAQKTLRDQTLGDLQAWLRQGGLHQKAKQPMQPRSRNKEVRLGHIRQSSLNPRPVKA